MESLVKLTDLEIQALKAITYSDFYENGRDSIPWDFSVYDACSIPSRKRGGVFSSLSMKGIIYIQEGERKFNIDANGKKWRNPYWSPDAYGTIHITKFGYKVLDNLQLIDENGSFIK
jgi:hypothetical protein